jgi:hypothetical protein
MRASLQPFPRSQSPWEVLTDLSVVGIATAEFDGGWVDVLSDPAGVVAHHGTTLIHLFREDTIFGVEEFGVTAGIDAVNLEVFDPRLELGAQLGAKCQGTALCERNTSNFRPNSSLLHHP